MLRLRKYLIIILILFLSYLVVYGAVDFQSADSDYASMVDSADFTLGTSFTLMAWIKTSDSQGEIIANFESGAPYQGFSWAIGASLNDGKQELYCADTLVGGFDKDDGNAVNTGSWIHLAVTRNGSDITWYQNGVQSATDTTTNQTCGDSSDAPNLARDTNSSPTRYLNGTIDELRIYKQVLTAAQIASAMNQRGEGNENTDLVLYYRSDEKSGVSLIDFTQRGNTATLQNSPTFVDSSPVTGLE